MKVKYSVSLFMGCLMLLMIGALFGYQHNDKTKAKTEKQVSVFSVESHPAVVLVGNEVEPKALPKVLQVDEPTVTTDTANGGVWGFLLAHWQAIVSGFLGFLEIITRLTATEKDNTVLAWIKRIFDFFIPNRAVGGGYHET